MDSLIVETSFYYLGLVFWILIFEHRSLVTQIGSLCVINIKTQIVLGILIVFRGVNNFLKLSRILVFYKNHHFNINFQLLKLSLFWLRITDEGS